MFDGLKNLGNLMKMAGQAKEKAAELQAELEKKQVIGESGGGAVRVTMNGKGVCRQVEFDSNLLLGLAGDDKTMVEELTAAAINQANEKVRALALEETRKLMGGMDLPPGLEDVIKQ